MLKVTITKLGKRIKFNGYLVSSPCKIFIDEKDETAMRVTLMRLGIGEKFFTIEKENAKPAKNENNAKVTKEVAKKMEQVSAEVKNEDPVAEVKEAEAPVAESKSEKKNKKR